MWRGMHVLLAAVLAAASVGRAADTVVSYNVAVLMASRLDSPFDLERCGPAIDLALKKVNDEYLSSHKVQLEKVQRR